MSIKTTLEIIAVGIHKKISHAKKLREIYDKPTIPSLYNYHDGRIDAFCEVLQDLEKIKKTVQEELPEAIK